MTVVVKNLLIINALVFIATNILNLGGLSERLVLYAPTNDNFSPYQFVTYMFMHGGFSHILFNMLGLWMFGSEIEYRLGPQKFLTYYIVCGLGAAALHFGLDYAIQGNSSSVLLGASGAVFGLLAAYGMLFPNNIIMPLFPPIPMKAKYFVMIYGAIELFAGVRNVSGDNTAHFAHLGGAVTGVILMLIWRQRGELN
ncbi:MAG: rhomboid family intramembrane serine protease [Sphingobacteriales bacterium]|nr:MAG: rhomboid family intramembrane serine protease [Sphingobacteriales bacterium]